MKNTAKIVINRKDPGMLICVIIIVSIIFIISTAAIVSMTISLKTDNWQISIIKELVHECKESIEIDNYTITLTGTYIEANTGVFAATFLITKEESVPEAEILNGDILKNGTFGENERFTIQLIITGGRSVLAEYNENALYIYFYAQLKDLSELNEIEDMFSVLDYAEKSSSTESGYFEYHFDLNDKIEYSAISCNIDSQTTIYVSAACVMMKSEKAGLEENTIESLSFIMRDGSSVDLVGGDDGRSSDVATVIQDFSIGTSYWYRYLFEAENLIDYNHIKMIIVNGTEYEIGTTS